jgi:hypothetical protein
MTEKPYLVAFKATSMETRISIIEWLRVRNAIHLLADVWLVKLPQTNAGDISHSIEQHDKFGSQLIVLELISEGTDAAGTGLSDEANSWISANLWS